MNIELTHGMVALIDEDDAGRLGAYSWHLSHVKGAHRYAARTDYTAGRPRQIFMHREMLGMKPGDGLMVDHINGNTLDNRRSNLRIATASGNSANSRRTSRNTSGFKGVTWHKSCAKWQAQIKVNGKTYHLGLFIKPELAHAAYCAASIAHFGEFARAA